MIFTNSVAIIRTKKGSVVGAHLIATHEYAKMNPNEFAYNGAFLASSFEIMKTIAGDVIVSLKENFPNIEENSIEIKHNAIFHNVTSIEITSEY